MNVTPRDRDEIKRKLIQIENLADSVDNIGDAAGGELAVKTSGFKDKMNRLIWDLALELDKLTPAEMKA